MDDFEERLKQATANIAPVYFKLPVFGREDDLYRERHYCYELYHQLRQDWPEAAYCLSAEIDKAGHPVIRGNELDNTKPDFLVHVPEDMSMNFAVIEVKPINGSPEGIKKDIRTMLAYLNHARYRRAFYLIYGSANDGAALESAKSQLRAGRKDRIELWWHSAPLQAAVRVI